MRVDIEIRLFDGFSMDYAGAPVADLTERQQSLLVYLLLNAEQPQPRSQVAFLFWPDSTDAQAQTNLRQHLYHLRQAWPHFDRCVQVTAKTMQWLPDIPYTLDIEQFETLLRRAEAAPAPLECCRLLAEAIALYRGDLLPGCYEDWILPERERLRSRFLKAQEQLIQLLEQQHEYQTAIRYAEQLLQHDPFHEEAYRCLMRLHALNNNRARALRVYHTCVTVLQEELGVEPSLATRQQYERLLNIDPSAPTQPVESTAAPASPLIGRSREWAALQRVWRQIRPGQARFVLVRGEAGIGKTRLLEEFVKWVALEGAVAAHTRSYAAQGRLAYGPVAAWLRSQSLRSRLSSLDEVWLSEVSRLLPELLVEQPQLPRPQPLTQSWQRQRFYEALARAILNQPDQQPLLLVIDDLQWSDQETLEWLSYLLHFAVNVRLLMIGSIRSGTVEAAHPLQPWLATLRQEQILTEIRLRPLDEKETAALAGHLALRELTVEQSLDLYRETEGNPFFIVETVRAALEQAGDAPPDQTRSQIMMSGPLPPGVQAIIESRLDQLSSAARDLAERAAVIGREFSFEVLAQASGLDDETLVRSLDELWQRRIVREQGATAYDFSHDKLREVVYAGISRARRRLLHRRVAEALLRVHAGDSDSVSAQLAAHYEQALWPQQAVTYYQRAAGVAQRVYANAEVVDLLTKALNLLDTRPAGAERDTQELSLRVALGPPLVALKGYSVPEVVDLYRQVLSLCQRLEQPPDPRALRGLAIANILQANYQQAWEFGQQILDLVQSGHDSVLLVEGHYAVGSSAFWRGEFSAARSHFEQALTHYSPNLRDIHINKYAQDPQIICSSRLAWTLWYLGYPEQAWQTMNEALTRPEAMTHPYSLTYARVFACFLAYDCQDYERLDQETSLVEDLTTRYNFTYFSEVALFVRGLVVALQGRPEHGRHMMDQVLSHWRQHNALLSRSMQLGWLARVCAQVGEVATGLAAIQTALLFVVQRDERFYEAELYRLWGELQRAQDAPAAEAAAHFHQAIEIAHRQQAKMLELRAAVSLGRLWQAAGAPEPLAEARQSLRSIYDGFTEGFDTPDLQAAQTLLAG